MRPGWSRLKPLRAALGCTVHRDAASGAERSRTHDMGRLSIWGSVTGIERPARALQRMGSSTIKRNPVDEICVNHGEKRPVEPPRWRPCAEADRGSALRQIANRTTGFRKTIWGDVRQQISKDEDGPSGPSSSSFPFPASRLSQRQWALQECALFGRAQRRCWYEKPYPAASRLASLFRNRSPLKRLYVHCLHTLYRKVS